MKRLLVAVLIAVAWSSSTRAALVFDQPHNGTGTLYKSSWYPPDGLDGDTYCWDNFTLGSNTAISEVHWRGGYELHPSGSGQSPVSDFEVSIYRSIGGNSQPDLGAGGRLAQFVVGGNAGETVAGSFGGVVMFDYAFALPAPFQALAGTTYWVEIVASQGAAAPSFAPDWGLAAGSGGNVSHFRKITGGTYQTIAGDLAFSLHASAAPTVTISASESPAGAGVVTGAGAYPVGSTASLLAAPNAGWGFVNWTEGAGVVSASSNYTFTANVDRTLVANFDTAYTIVTYSSPLYGGTVSGAGVYTRGSTVTLVATPHHGFVFSSWSDGNTSATHTFAAAFDAQLTAFFVSAPGTATFDFDNARQYAPFPIDLTSNGLTAHFTGNYSIQAVGTLGIAPAGFSGLCVWPSSIYQADLGIKFSALLTDFSVLYAVDELACDVSARMRVTAYKAGLSAGTATMIAPVPGTYPSATLSIAVPTGFDSAVVHWDAPGSLCQDYGPIFFADNVTVTLAVPIGVGDLARPMSSRLYAPVPNPFRKRVTLGFALSEAAQVRLGVYDVLGRCVATLLDGSLGAGEHSATWEGTRLGGGRAAPGVYLVRLERAGKVEARRVVLLR